MQQIYPRKARIKEMITQLEDNQIFVFGSNLAGINAGGAARQAKEQFGAQDGVGEGMTGQCYAFPTLTPDFSQRDKEALMTSVDRFFTYAINHPKLTFLMTAVGTGIANYSEHYMKSLFENPPDNVKLPPEWISKAAPNQEKSK